MRKVMTLMVLLASSQAALAEGYSYQEIAKRHPKEKLDQQTLDKMKMQAECLVGIKKINYKRKDNFDPIAEWTSYRTKSLLEVYSPCETLVIIELAQGILKKEK